ncbi:MAG: YvrJ family protein [Bacillota bacterium]
MGEAINYELLGMIANLGFPMAISIYLLVRLENRMEALAERIKELGEAIRRML